MRLERNVVVELRFRLRSGRCLCRRCRTFTATLKTTARVATATAEHLHVARADFGRITVVAVFILPLASLEQTFDLNQRAFSQVHGHDFGQPVKRDNAMPFGLFDLLTRLLVLP